MPVKAAANFFAVTLDNCGGSNLHMSAVHHFNLVF
jgi:hypothetical protein